MSTRPEALRLTDFAFADRDGWWHTLADNELQRLHFLNEDRIKIITDLLEQRDELLEALRWYVENDDVSETYEGKEFWGDLGNEFWLKGRARARAAIAKAEGNT